MPNCIEWRTEKICEGDKVRTMIGIKIFIGVIEEIDEYNNIVLKDVKNNVLVFKLKNVKFIQKLTDDEFNRIIQRYKQQ